MTLLDLCTVTDEKRDEHWEDQFLHQLTLSNINVLSPDPQVGPDGWPYLFVEANSDANEPAQKVIHWLAKKGIGLVVNPTKTYPDFVLTFGMLWSFLETGKFIDRAQLAEVNESGHFAITPAQITHYGKPNEKYLPDYVSSILKQFFLDQGVLAPKILVFSTDGKRFDFALSLESLGNPPESEWTGIGEAISWFLPPHYSVVLISEKGLPAFSGL